MGKPIINTPREDDLQLILRSDFDKYVNWLMTTEAISKKEKKASYDSLVEVYLGSVKKKIRAKKMAKEDIYVKTKYWIPPTVEEKQNFAFWRKGSFDEEISFSESAYQNSVLPPDAIIAYEVERVCKRIQYRYPQLIVDIMEGRLTEDYYDTARLIGKIDYLKTLVTEKTSNKKIEEKYKTLPELFENREVFEQCLEVLRGLKVIDKSKNYIGSIKGVFVIWIKEMGRRKIIPYADDKTYSHLVSRYFNNFSISESTFRSPNSKAKKNYEVYIRNELSKIKSV